ncbi:MAG: class I SAM-dependent methyltransferase [Anaerolineae bacterium]|nr:class I SAM-dependent methyltransferase [Anaerolineae bacterium]
MSNPVNQSVYQIYAPIYDWLFGAIMQKARRHSIELLHLQLGDNLLIPGIGTGLDLPFIPSGIHVTGTDISQAMLSKAQKKTRKKMNLLLMDAQALQFPASSFDAVLLNLILSVAPDGKKVLEEAWRVLRPGGQLAIFDKFLPEQEKSTVLRVIVGGLLRWLGTDPNRRFSDMVKEIPGVVISCDEPVMLRGQYRVILMNKPLESFKKGAFDVETISMMT